MATIHEELCTTYGKQVRLRKSIRPSWCACVDFHLVNDRIVQSGLGSSCLGGSHWWNPAKRWPTIVSNLANAATSNTKG